MITKISHVSVYVLDQDSAHDFYVNKLGFEVRTDAPIGPDARWLTVGPKDQPEIEITLMPIKPGMQFNEDSAKTMTDLVKQGTFGFGVFETNDAFATYEELKAKGVEFKKPPSKEFYGTEAIFVDDSGNWFSLHQH